MSCDFGLALQWIVALLNRLGVPYQAVGGLAARAYGAERPLADLDFYVPTDRLGDVAVTAASRVVRQPSLHRDESWDLTFMKLEYDGCVVELAGADDARYFDRRKGGWRSACVDFAASIDVDVLGVRTRTMPYEQLVEYKRALDRRVDREDLAAMARGHGQRQ